MPNIEWSGVLFYTAEGSMETDDLVLTCRDLYLMDIGVSTYTEFDMSPDVISYMAGKPELLDMNLGLFHSHNQMSCFFSGTDIQTLKEEGRDRNHFLSLIVNNAGTYEAAITRKVKSISTVTEVYEYKSFNDEVKTGEKVYEEQSEAIEYYMLDITKEGKQFSFRELDERLDEIKKKKDSEKRNAVIKTPVSTGYLRREDYPKKNWDMPSLFGSYTEIPDEEVEACNKPETSSTYSDVNMEDANNVLCQMLTGNVIIRDYSSFDLDKWVEEMEEVFNRRFGNNSVGLKDYEMWADQFCEFLINNIQPEIKDAQEEAQWMSDFSETLLMSLETLEENKYIKILKEVVSQWII